MVRGDDSSADGGQPADADQVIPFAVENGLAAVERRAELAHLNIQGPRSRDLLAAVTPADVSNEAFPYYTFKDAMPVAGVEDAFVTRMGFTAELGYELFVPGTARSTSTTR